MSTEQPLTNHSHAARSRRLNLRTLLLMLAGVLAGVAWGWLSLRSTGGARGAPALRALVWTISATPLATCLAWLLARPRDLWRALLVCAAVYFFSIFVAARLERLALGREEAERTLHLFYFNAVLIAQASAGIALAIERALQAPGARPGLELEDVVK